MTWFPRAGENKGWEILSRMGWTHGQGLGYREDGPITSTISIGDSNGGKGFGLRHASEDHRPPTAASKETWEIGPVPLSFKCWSSLPIIKALQTKPFCKNFFPKLALTPPTHMPNTQGTHNAPSSPGHHYTSWVASRLVSWFC